MAVVARDPPAPADRPRNRAARVLVLALHRFWTQNMLHHAAALTYNSLLALFQAILLGVALLGLLGSSETLGDLSRFLVRRGVDEGLVEGLIAAGQHAISSRATSAVALGVAIVVALFVASSAFVAATVALNVVVEARDDRSILVRRGHALAGASVVILLGVGAMIGVFLGGDLAERLLDRIGLGGTIASVWPIVRYPLGALLAMTAFAWVYFAAPTVPDPHWRWISMGAAIAVAVWLAASVGLFLFASEFDTYNATYGTFATAMLLVVWLWLTNVALLVGAEVNAAGRYVDGTAPPLSRTGDSPEQAQHEAARHQR